MYIHYFYKYTKRLHADIKYESYLQQVAVQEKMISIILFYRSEKRTFNYNLIDKNFFTIILVKKQSTMDFLIKSLYIITGILII